MGAQLRVYKRRIKTVTATKKITRAMEMIAASRILKAQRQVAASAPYAEALTAAATAVAQGSDVRHPLTSEAERPRRAAVLLISSDRGLAGGYSANIIKSCEQLTGELTGRGLEVDTYVVGRKGVAYYAFREQPIAQSWTGFTDSPAYADAKRVAAPLIEAIQRGSDDGGVDELHIAATEFVSMMTQTPVGRRMLPLTLHPPPSPSPSPGPRPGPLRPAGCRTPCTSSSPRPSRCSTPCCRGTLQAGSTTPCSRPRPPSTRPAAGR